MEPTISWIIGPWLITGVGDGGGAKVSAVIMLWVVLDASPILKLPRGSQTLSSLA